MKLLKNDYLIIDTIHKESLYYKLTDKKGK